MKIVRYQLSTVAHPSLTVNNNVQNLSMRFCFYMKKIFITILCYFIFTGTLYAEVSQFVFTNEVRAIAPSVISESLTVQSQNSGGVQESVTETTDLVFQSSSGSGQFLNTSGNPVSTTMSKNTANRTFYYRDSTVGTHTLTVTATGRESGKVMRATQSITVGTSPNSPTNSLGSTASTTQSTSSTSNTSLSAHSSPSPAFDSKPVVSFEVSAGRNRFSSVGSEVVFKAEPIKLSGVSENYIQYTWVFGDGATANGQTVSHRYAFSGEYVVVLNAVYSDRTAVSRTEVIVINPIFDIEYVSSGGVRLVNKSLGEVNVGEWVIEGGAHRLDIPRDTIIKQGKAITFPWRGTLTESNILVLKNPLGTVVASGSLAEKTEDVVAEGQEVLPLNTAPEPIVKIVYVDRPVTKQETAPVEKPIAEVKEQDSGMVATVYSASPKPSAVESLLWIPKKGWGLLADLFR